MNSIESAYGNWTLKIGSGFRRLGAVALVAALIALPVPAMAATFTVTNLTDGAAPGPAGSLRAAVTSANTNAGADTINFQPGLTGTITLTNGQLTLTDTTGATTLAGPGANVITVSGNNAGRVFLINASVTASISSLTIANGSTVGSGAGLLNSGALTLTGCTVRNNIAISSDGGGVLGNPGSSMTLTNCLFTANQARFGAAIEQFSANLAVITNCTVTGNTINGTNSGAIDAGNGGVLRLESCTVTGNTAPAGAAAVFAFGGGSSIQYRNTIVSGNSPVQFANNGGTLTSLGHNLSSDASGGLTAPGDLPNTNPLLGPLADNGGPTQTFALLAGSPAINAGDPVTFPATDQRGVSRPGGDACAGATAPDIGAVELAQSFKVTNLNDSGAGSLRQAVNDNNNTLGGGTVCFLPGLTGTITLTSGALTLSRSVTINGPGANVITVSGNNAARVFLINAGVTAAISGLTIANGSTNAGGAGLYNQGTLTLTACTVRNNTDTSFNGGGGLWSDVGSSMTLTGCLFTANQSIFGSAIEQYSANEAVITNVTVSGNTTTGADAGIIEAFGGSIRLESCTVTGNTSGPGNAAAVDSYGGTVQYRNTIVSANTPNQFAANAFGTVTSLGHNISSDGTGNLTATGDLPNTNPLLGPLADNGGPTQTFAPLAGSPAIDAGDPVNFPATDQRGIARPLAVLSCTTVPDIGAFEVQPQDCNANFIPDGCDIAAPHIYWSNDTANTIQRAVASPTNLNIQTVANTGAATLRGVAVDTVHAKVYWSDTLTNVIKQANLDGTGAVTLVTSPLGNANDITLDVAGGWMYWANGDNGTLYRSDLNGGGVTPLVIGQTGPSGIALDLAGGKMCWVDQTGNAIRRANLDGTNIETLIGAGLSGPIDISLDIPGGKMYWAEIAGARIRRANLDGTVVQDLATGLNGPTSVALDLPAGKVYWSSSTLQKIERANLDGTGREDVITGVGQIYRIAFIQRSADCDADGTLDECALNVPIEQVYVAAPGSPIPDNNPTGVSSTITVATGGVVTDLDVLVNIPHTWQGDVVATLSHRGVTRTLINRVGLCFDSNYGYSADNFGPPGGFLTLDDAAPVSIDCYAGPLSAGIDNYAGPARPNQALAAFNGLDPSGPWTLTVSDPLVDFTGTLATWALAMQTTSADCNANGVPDECEPDLHRGDMNCDCAVTVADVPGFIQALLDPAAYVAANPACNLSNADMQPDGALNGRDVQLFVDKLTS